MNFNEKPYLRSVELKRDSIASFESYPFCVPSVTELDSIDFHEDVTFFVGENGSGKSTLLEAIAVALGFNPEGGNKNTNFSTNENHSELSKYLKIIRGFKKPGDWYFLRVESFYNLASYMELDGRAAYLESYGGKSLHQQSHGESFMTTLLNKLRGHGLYLMDEPEAALSPTRQMAALSAIHQLVEDKSQFIVATHSPILLAYPRAKIYQFSSLGIMEVKYTETEHFEVTKEFLNNYEGMLEILMSD
jgi:predicted ATPase